MRRWMTALLGFIVGLGSGAVVGPLLIYVTAAIEGRNVGASRDVNFAPPAWIVGGFIGGCIGAVVGSLVGVLRVGKGAGAYIGALMGSVLTIFVLTQGVPLTRSSIMFMLLGWGSLALIGGLVAAITHEETWP